MESKLLLQILDSHFMSESCILNVFFIHFLTNSFIHMYIYFFFFQWIMGEEGSCSLQDLGFYLKSL